MSTAPKRLINKSVGVFVPLLVLAGHNIATKRLRAHVKERRKTWVRHHRPAMQAHPARLVFLVFFDEASVKKHSPPQIRAQSVRQAFENECTGRRMGTQTFTAGLKRTLSTPWVIKIAMDGEAIEGQDRNILAPNP